MYAGKYAEASAKFRDAVARVPEPKYFFNLCTSLFQEGKFGEAMTACNAVRNNNPTPDLQAKADKLIGKIQDEAKAQDIDAAVPPVVAAVIRTCPPTRSIRTTRTTCRPIRTTRTRSGTRSSRSSTRRPSGVRPRRACSPRTSSDNKYTWTLGVDLFGGGGRIGQADYYGSSAGGFRIKGDYLLNAAPRVGAQGYFQLSHFGQGEMDAAVVDTLDIIDLGIAAYKHLCPRSSPRLCLTPLAGAQIALMSPAE